MGRRARKVAKAQLGRRARKVAKVQLALGLKELRAQLGLKVRKVAKGLTGRRARKVQQALLELKVHKVAKVQLALGLRELRAQMGLKVHKVAKGQPGWGRKERRARKVHKGLPAQHLLQVWSLRGQAPLRLSPLAGIYVTVPVVLQIYATNLLLVRRLTMQE
jgi:hypothetical protein